MVFYNGTADKPDKEILRLSDAFVTPPDEDLGQIELTIPVYNINVGKNSELLNKSEKLRHYAEFIGKVREFERDSKSYAQAVKEAINYCIKNNVLADFLREHGGEIVSILSVEYDEEIARKVYADEQVDEKILEIAIRLLDMNLSVEQIVSATGLTIEKVQNVKNGMEANT